MNRTYLSALLKAFWPMAEASGANRQNVLNPGTFDLVQAGGVTQVAGPTATITYATELVQASAQTLTLTADNLLDQANPWSINLWARAANNGLSITPLQWANAGNSQLFSTELVYSSPFAIPAVSYQGPYAGVSAQGMGTAIVFPSATWHMYTMTFDTANLFLYLDGLLQAGVTAGLVGGEASTVWTMAPVVANSLLDICQMGAWARVLNGADVTQLWNNGNGLPYPF